MATQQIAIVKTRRVIPQRVLLSAEIIERARHLRQLIDEHSRIVSDWERFKPSLAPRSELERAEAISQQINEIEFRVSRDVMYALEGVGQ